MTPQLAFYPGQHVQCLGCEDGCCVRFEIPVTRREAEEVLQLGLPGVPARFEECFEPDERGEWRVRKRADGRCIFADGRRCAIHALRGYAAKPLCCRIFPLHIQKWEDGAFSAELRYICPAAGLPDGRKLALMQSEIATLARQLGDRRGVNCCVFSDSNPAPLRTVRKIHAGFQRILHEEEQSWRLRLYTAVRILDFHAAPAMREAVRAADDSFATEAASFAAKARHELENELSHGTFDALIRSRTRNLLCGYLRSDRPGSTSLHGRLARARTNLRVITGIGQLCELNPAAPKISILQTPMLGAALQIAPEAATLFREYFYGKLDSMNFCGSQILRYDYETGFRHLLLMPATLFPLAAGFALHRNLDRIDFDAMHRAVRLIDFTFARSPFFRTRIARRWIHTLTCPKQFAGLVSHAVPPGTF